MIHDLYDIAIVGAGPAGSIAGYVAARRGFSVALIDRYTFPRDKACGDGIGPGAVRIVRDLGLGRIFDGHRPVGTITVFGPNGTRSDSAVPALDGKPATGFVIPRLQFDERLFQEAVKAGAEDLTGNRFIGMELRREDRLVRIRDSSGNRRNIAARLVLGADGAYSSVRKALVDRKDPKRSKHNGFAMRAYAYSSVSSQYPDQQPGLVLEFSRDLLPSYGWMFPIGADRINIGVGGPLDVLQRRRVPPAKLLANYIDSVRARGIEIRDIRDQRAHHLPHVAGMPALAHPRAALIGDAASMINPVSGEGIAYAVVAAAQLVDGLPERLDDNTALAEALARFEQDFRARFRSHFISSRVVLRLLRSSTWSSLLVRSMQQDTKVLSDAIDMLFGFGRFHPATALRVLKAQVQR